MYLIDETKQKALNLKNIDEFYSFHLNNNTVINFLSAGKIVRAIKFKEQKLNNETIIKKLILLVNTEKVMSIETLIQKLKEQ